MAPYVHMTRSHTEKNKDSSFQGSYQIFVQEMTMQGASTNVSSYHSCMRETKEQAMQGEEDAGE